MVLNQRQAVELTDCLGSGGKKPFQALWVRPLPFDFPFHSPLSHLFTLSPFWPGK